MVYSSTLTYSVGFVKEGWFFFILWQRNFVRSVLFVDSKDKKDWRTPNFVSASKFRIWYIIVSFVTVASVSVKNNKRNHSPLFWLLSGFLSVWTYADTASFRHANGWNWCAVWLIYHGSFFRSFLSWCCGCGIFHWNVAVPGCGEPFKQAKSTLQSWVNVIHLFIVFFHGRDERD